MPCSQKWMDEAYPFPWNVARALLRQDGMEVLK